MSRVAAKIDAVRSGAYQPFDDARVETYARCRSAGQSQKKAGEESGISHVTGIKLEKDPKFVQRLAELRESRREHTSVSLVSIMDRLWRNANEAADAGDFKASNQAAIMLAEMVRKDMGQVTGSFSRMVDGSPKQVKMALRDELGSAEILEALAEENDPVTSDK